MSIEIRRGLRLSTEVEAAARAFERGFEEALSGVGSWQRHMGEALCLDPDFILARFANRDAGDSTLEFEREVDAAELTPWEREHIRLTLARGTLAGGEWAQQALFHVRCYPADAWMFDKLQGYAFFFGSASIREQVDELALERALGFGDDPYWLTRGGFALVERGQPVQGLVLLDEVVARWPENLAAWHSRLHALHALGRHRDVANACVLQESSVGKFAWHVAWHRALVLLGEGEIATAVDLFQRRCGPQTNGGFDHLALADVVGFVWAHLVAVGEPPKLGDSGSELYARTSGLPAEPFVLLHRGLLGAWVDSADLSELPCGPLGRIARSVRAGDWGGVIASFDEVTTTGIAELGGSRLQKASLALALTFSLEKLGRGVEVARRLQPVMPFASTHPVIASYLRSIAVAA